MINKFKKFDDYYSKLNDLLSNVIVTHDENKISIEKGLKFLKKKNKKK